MNGHPPDVIGWWSILVANLYINSINGKIELPLGELANLLNTTPAKTKYLIEYLQNKEIACVTTKEKIYGTQRILLITITSNQKYFSENNCKSTRIRREEWFDEIKQTYHPAKATKQPRIAIKEYLRLLINASKNTTTRKDAISAELRLHKKILDYIDFLKHTPEWENGGKFLLGLGNFLISKQWEIQTIPENNRDILTLRKEVNNG